MNIVMESGIDGSGRISMKIPPCIKLLAKGPISPLNATVILRSCGRKHVKGNAEFGAGFLEIQYKFRAAIDLNRDHWKGRILNAIIKEKLGIEARGS